MKKENWIKVDEQRLEVVPDLFETPEVLPKEVRTIVENCNMDEQSYETCETLIKELNKVGYTCEYGLDGIPFNLQKLD